ncbi:response regulator transcription factor [Pedobacter nanyangensis]|uniref:response regulator transcription factor n=1 Tax=Pedobacter nanyangensis TaxID=1562389 RepID=UPI000DE5218C|nr:response regulator transcription factor [Pedobacter nanyangensis]
MSEKEKLTILIADDHAIVRFGLALLLREMNPATKCIEAISYEQVRAMLATQHIDLLILDIHMPGGDNIRSVEDFKIDFPELKILIFSSYPEKIYADRYLKAGADGYLHKDTSEEGMKNAIRLALKNERSWTTEDHKHTAPYIAHHLDVLSDRELDVARLLAEGWGNLEIANSLKLQMSTVSTYKKRIFDKLNVNNIPELIQKFSS